MRPIYITGHKNPDTDSIVSSIAYASYKKAKGIQAIASRIGPVASDTEYLLNRFHFEDPLHIYTAKSTVREIDFDKAKLIDEETTIKKAIDLIKESRPHTIYVADKARKLLGIVTLDSVSNVFLANEKEATDILKHAKLANIAKILKAKVVVKSKNFNIDGSIDISPVKDADLNKGTIAITSNIKKIKRAIKDKAGLIIVLDGIELDETTIDAAIKNDVAIIASPLKAVTIAKLIYLTAPVHTIMERVDKITSIKDSMTTDEATSIITKTRYRAYPILDGHGFVIGSLSRYHVLNYTKKKLILVDHNEKKQSIDDIEAGEVLEIIDHHRFGGFESTNPINIQTQIVGATVTIIANKFLDEDIKIDKNLAGLMLGGIVADTLNFKSPTTTKLDIETAKKLEKISGVTSKELQEGLVKSSESIVTKRAKDICHDDYKEFKVNGYKIGVAQAICKSFDEYKAIRTPVSTYMEDACLNANLDLFILMLTDPNGSGSYLIYFGNKANIVKQIYPKILENNFVNHLISRKKQLLPALIEALNS